MLLTTPFIIAGAATIFTFQTWSIISPHEDTDSAIDALSDTSKVIKDKSAEAVNWTKDKTQDAVEWTKERAQGAVDWTRGHATDLFTKMRRRLTGVQMDSAHSDKAQVRILPEEYLVFIDIAGIPTSSLKVHIDGHQLLIYGEHEECITKGGRRACWERTIEEIFDLPEDADQEQVEAWVNLQVLHVKIPRKALKADRVIKVGHKGTIEKILEKVGFEE